MGEPIEQPPTRGMWQRLIHRWRKYSRDEVKFELLVRRSERLARANAAAAAEAAQAATTDDSEFAVYLQAAIDRLPAEFQKVLESVPVVISDLGDQHHAYGLYQGDGVANDAFPDRIMIFQDTLERDFGYDRSLLAAQIERTLRHELAHHLGWFTEEGVRNLGL